MALDREVEGMGAAFGGDEQRHEIVAGRHRAEVEDRWAGAVRKGLVKDE